MIVANVCRENLFWWMTWHNNKAGLNLNQTWRWCSLHSKYFIWTVEIIWVYYCLSDFFFLFLSLKNIAKRLVSYMYSLLRCQHTASTRISYNLNNLLLELLNNSYGLAVLAWSELNTQFLRLLTNNVFRSSFYKFSVC